MIIYKTTNLINGKIYIGQQSYVKNKYYLGSGNIVKRAIKKYGKNNFKKEVIEYCKNQDELNDREIYWINAFDSTNKEIGYNITLGGGGALGVKASKETKDKISKNHADVSGNKNPMFGKTHTKEVREILRKVNTGKNHSNITKKKMSNKKMGEFNNKSKLSKTDVLEIRRLYNEENKTQREIAKLFNIQHACVYKIVNYKTWRHI